MDIEYLRLAETINEARNCKPIILVGNVGNWGDALIKQGTYAFLRYFGIPFREYSFNDSLLQKLNWRNPLNRQRAVVYMGGGGWCGHFYSYAQAIASASRKFRFRKHIVLPSTFDLDVDVSELTLFRRDQLQSKDRYPNSVFCHDMAFFLPRVDSNRSRDGVGNFFRTDSESPGRMIPPDNIDLSALGQDSTPIFEFLERISKCSEIKTDRLHICIGACLTGTPVQLFEGNHFKNGAVFKSSIEGRFPLASYVSE